MNNAEQSVLGGIIADPSKIKKVREILTHDDFPEGIPEGYVVLSIKR